MIKSKLAILQKRNTLGSLQNNQIVDINTKSNFKDGVWTVQVNDKFSTNKNLIKRNTTNSMTSKNNDEESLKDKTKTFICTGGYPAIRQALVSRGWVENNNSTRYTIIKIVRILI